MSVQLKHKIYISYIFDIEHSFFMNAANHITILLMYVDYYIYIYIYIYMVSVR